jgi:hypothetical protein
MESLVLLHAVIIAVFYILAFADSSQDISAVAPLTDSNYQLFTFSKFECKFILI